MPSRWNSLAATFAVVATLAFAPCAVAQSFREQQQYQDWKQQQKELEEEQDEVKRKFAEKQARRVASVDMEVPVIEVDLGQKIDANAKTYRITGLVGDNSSPPRLSVNGRRQLLFKPRSDRLRIATYTLAFDIDIAGRIGGKPLVLEVCDAAGNCVFQQVAASGPDRGTLLGAAVERPVRIKRLDVALTCSHQLRYSDRGSGADMNVIIYEPVPPSDYYIVGGYAQDDYDNPHGCATVVRPIGQDRQGSLQLLATPSDWKLVWKDRWSGASMDGSVWQAVPPNENYECLGSVGQTGYNKPDVPNYVCIHSCLVEDIEASNLVWWDKGSSATDHVSLFHLPKVNSFRARAGYDLENQLKDLKAETECQVVDGQLRSDVTRVADVELPVIQIAAPQEVDVSAGTFAITGLVGDDGSPARLKVNGEPKPLFKPRPTDPTIAKHTLAFSLEFEAGEVGEKRVVLEACDAAENCIAERVVVRVVPSAQAAAAEWDAEELREQLAEARTQAAEESARKLAEERARQEQAAEESARKRAEERARQEQAAAAPADETRRQLEAFQRQLEELQKLAHRVPEPSKKAAPFANRPNIHGRNYALIIGNNNYANLPDLKTAVGDAAALSELLKLRYDFTSGDVKLLLNADKATIMDELAGLRQRLQYDDRLLIYYAGHGQIDPVTKEGFWQPIDAVSGKEYTWIANDAIRRQLRGLPAKHVLVVADSCFSGSLTRSTASYENIPKNRYFTEIDSHVSRKVISSGGTEPVADAGSGGHSVFAYYLLKTLRENDRPYLTSMELFQGLVRAVTNNSNQKPEFGTVGDAGDEGSGDFIFILKSGG